MSGIFPPYSKMYSSDLIWNILMPGRSHYRLLRSQILHEAIWSFFLYLKYYFGCECFFLFLSDRINFCRCQIFCFVKSRYGWMFRMIFWQEGVARKKNETNRTTERLFFWKTLFNVHHWILCILTKVFITLSNWIYQPCFSSIYLYWSHFKDPTLI